MNINNNEPNDNELLKLMRDLNPVVRQEGSVSWVERDYEALLAFAKRKLYSSCIEQAQDVAQEVFLIALINVASGQYKHKGRPLRAYLFGIAKNVIREINRNCGKYQPMPEGFDPPDEKGPNVDALIDLEDILTQVKRAYQSLSDEEKHILNELYIQGKTANQVAKELGYKPGNVRQKAHRAIKKVQAYLIKHYALELSTEQIIDCLKALGGY